MFRTLLQPSPSDNKISHNSSIVTIGSCFANTIGDKLIQNKFKALTNPFGVLFNPESIFKLLNYTIDNIVPEENTFLELDGVHKNFDFHSDFAAASQDELRLKIQGAIQSARVYLEKADYLIITLGTSTIFTKKDTEQVVANCHKVNSSEFTRSLLTVDSILNAFQKFYQSLKFFNSNIKVILTVSPVRHIKDTLEINNISKSILRIAANEMQKMDDVQYFPAFEALIDDLRDYRFYTKDMLHPNEVAEDYIWSLFSDSYFDTKTKELMAKWNKVKKSLDHKPLQSFAHSYHDFQSRILDQLLALQKDIDVTKEIDKLQSRMGES